MNKEKINQMFDGRWRIKSQHIEEELETLLINPRVEYVKGLCRDFFEAGIILAQRCVVSSSGLAMAVEHPTSYDEAMNTEFEDFWNLYDKKVGRPKAEKLWAKLSEKEKADCMAYIPLYKQAQSDKQYRKNPETFLRNKSFYDEIIIRDSKDQQRSQRIAEAANLVAKYTGADKGTKG